MRAPYRMEPRMARPARGEGVPGLMAVFEWQTDVSSLCDPSLGSLTDGVRDALQVA